MISVPGDLIFCGGGGGGGGGGVLVPGFLIGEGVHVGRACCLEQQFSNWPGATAHKVTGCNSLSPADTVLQVFKNACNFGIVSIVMRELTAPSWAWDILN